MLSQSRNSPAFTNYGFHNRTPLVHIPRHKNPVDALPSFILNTHFSIIIPFTPQSSKLSPCCRFPHQNPLRISRLSCAYYVPRPPMGTLIINMNATNYTSLNYAVFLHPSVTSTLDDSISPLITLFLAP